MRNRVAWYGWRADTPDHRDLLFSSRRRRRLPKIVDLRADMPAIYDQGELGSCTANAIAAAIEYDRMKQKLEVFTPSRLFIYYYERLIEGTIDSDAGAEIRDGMKVIAKQGTPAEHFWPYDPWAERFTQKPHDEAISEAGKHICAQYKRVTRTLTQLRTCLADGFPFVFGFSVYEEFEGDKVAKTGVLNMPKKSEAMVGGHAVMAVGYDDHAKRFIVRNSWAADWGQQGYFTMPYDYVMNHDLADDFWCVRLVK